MVDKIVSWWREARIPVNTAIVLGGAILLMASLALDRLDMWSASKKKPAPATSAEEIYKKISEAEDLRDKQILEQIRVKVVELGHCQYWAGKATATLVHLGNCTNHGTFVKTMPVEEKDYWYAFCRDKAGYDKYQAGVREAFSEYKKGVKASP